MIHSKEYTSLLPFNKKFEINDECTLLLNNIWHDYQIIFDLYDKYNDECADNGNIIYVNKKGVIENKISSDLNLNASLNLKEKKLIDIEPIIFLMGKYKESEIYKLAGSQFNIMSPMQLAKILFVMVAV